MEKWHRRFLSLAEHISGWSKDPSTKCGAVIVRPDKTIAATGFNGFPQKMRDEPHYLNDRPQKYSRVIHAEMNALLFAREPVRGYTIYVWPMPPCDRCITHIIQAGIERVVALKSDNPRWQFAMRQTRQFCKEAGVELVEMQE